LLDHESQREAMRCRIILGLCIDHVGVGIAVIAVIGPDQFTVLRDPVGIVDVAAEQEAQRIGCRSLDHRIELPRAEDVIADETDPLHRRLLAFGDGEDEIDAIIAVIDDLRDNADIVAPDMPVGLHDAPDIGLHGRALQRAPRL
jgi:hypothetical protein